MLHAQLQCVSSQVSTHFCACIHMPTHHHSHHLLRASAVLMGQALQLYLKTSSKQLF